MGWTSKMRANRYSSFNTHGDYRGGAFSHLPRNNEKKELSEDTKNRLKVVEEIHERCKQGEELREIVNEIATREEIKEQFGYYLKNGITDLPTIFENWYKGHLKKYEQQDKMR